MKLFSIFIFLGITFCCFSDEIQSICTQCSGFKIFGKQQVSSIHETQNTRLIHANVLEKTSVYGHLSSENSTINSFDVVGQATFILTKVKGAGTITGSFSAVDSQFERELIVSTESKVILNNCHLKDLIFAKGFQIELRKHCQVDGDIVFKNKPGEVVLDSFSEVHGKVINGKIIKKH